MSDSEQNQVESVESLVDDGSRGAADDGENGPKSKEESEETEAVDSEVDSGKDENAQSKVLLSESLGEQENEPDQKVAESAKEEKEVAVPVVAVQKELSSKTDDSKSEVPVEEELKKSDDKNGKTGDAEKDNLISAQAKEPVDETPAQVSKESDKTQALSCVDEVLTLVSDTGEKTTDFTAETKSTLSVEKAELPEKAQVSSEPFAEETPQVLKEAEDINSMLPSIMTCRGDISGAAKHIIRVLLHRTIAEETPQVLKEAEDINSIAAGRIMTYRGDISEETPQVLKEAEDINSMLPSIMTCRGDISGVEGG
ncbi:hypothetical protein GBF38_000065 [Nibea albiflora]|nr:hypothetical protein GBF38_000065 [Nibea albiflora]